MQRENIVREIRAFNRFYVDLIGLLNAGGYHSSYTLAETRFFFEINEAASIQASQIMLKIHIDKSYLSRILRKLEKNGLLSRTRSDQDARAVMLSLTEKGKSEIENINHAASDLVSAQINALDEVRCQQLVDHMKAIKELLILNNESY
jgi:DNA-binding MarR family transcriptional regulator